MSTTCELDCASLSIFKGELIISSFDRGSRRYSLVISFYFFNFYWDFKVIIFINSSNYFILALSPFLWICRILWRGKEIGRRFEGREGNEGSYKPKWSANTFFVLMYWFNFLDFVIFLVFVLYLTILVSFCNITFWQNAKPLQ